MDDKGSSSLRDSEILLKHIKQDNLLFNKLVDVGGPESVNNQE